MASQNCPQNLTVGDLELTCDLCKSDEIVETEQGYVCSACGVVLEVTKFEYHRPYEETRVQHAVLGTTQIGHTHERSRTKNSRKYHKLHKISKSISSTSQVDTSARVIIKRLVEKLDLPRSLRKALFTKYKQARSEFEPGTKFRNPEKLIPGILYYHCKFNCLPIDERILLENSEIGKKDFYELKLRVLGIMPKYYNRDRQEFIKTCLMQLKEEYHLDMAFYHDANHILEKLWDGIKCTTDDVIAGLVGSIVILCRKKYNVNVNSICNHLNIQMSTIQSQVKRKIIERFRISGFTSLVASADILRDVMDKLGLIKVAAEDLAYEEELLNEVFEDIEKEDNSEVCDEAVAEGETEDSGSNSEILDDMVLITADEVMPARSRYIFVIRDEVRKTPIFIRFSPPENERNDQKPPKKDHIEFEILRYHFAKGPPIPMIR